MQCEDFEGSCLSQTQVTKVNKIKGDRIKEKSRKKNISRGGNTGDKILSIFIPTPTIAPTYDLQITLSPQPCMSSSSCIYPLVPSVTPSPTSTPQPLLTNDDLVETVQYLAPSNPLMPDFAPGADDIWDIIGGALPLINQPATSLNQITNSAVNAAINATRALSNGLSNAGVAVNEAIGNGLNYGPVMPIFYIPSPEDLFPISGPVYN